MTETKKSGKTGAALALLTIAGIVFFGFTAKGKELFTKFKSKLSSANSGTGTDTGTGVTPNPADTTPSGKTPILPDSTPKPPAPTPKEPPTPQGFVDVIDDVKTQTIDVSADGMQSNKMRTRNTSWK